MKTVILKTFHPTYVHIRIVRLGTADTLATASFFPKQESARLWFPDATSSSVRYRTTLDAVVAELEAACKGE